MPHHVGRGAGCFRTARASLARRTTAGEHRHRIPTGLSVVALDRAGTLVTSLSARDSAWTKDAVLVMLGSLEQRRKFAELFEKASS